jgi:hypothetical protein
VPFHVSCLPSWEAARFYYVNRTVDETIKDRIRAKNRTFRSALVSRRLLRLPAMLLFAQHPLIFWFFLRQSQLSDSRRGIEAGLDSDEENSSRDGSG